MRCSRAEALLPQYLDAGLPPADHEAVAAHLAACSRCRRAQTGLESSLRSLQRVARDAGPDLWSRFQRRLDQDNPSPECIWVRERMAAQLDGSDIPSERPALDHHLEACPACERERLAYRRSLTALERVARSVPQVDLWPALAARLEPGPSPAERRAWTAQAIRNLLLGGLRQPLLPAVLALGATAALVFGMVLEHSFAARRVVSAPVFAGRVALGTGPAAPSAAPFAAVLEHPAAEQPQPRGVKRPEFKKHAAPGVRVAAGARITDRGSAALPPRRVPRVRHHATFHMPTFARREARPSETTVEHPMRLASTHLQGTASTDAASQDWPAGLKVSYHVSPPGDSHATMDVPASLTTPSQQRVVQNEILHTVELLVGVEDAATRPFGSNANTR